MKKILMLASAMLLCFSAAVSAEDIAIDYDIDFDNSIINIHCITEAKYNQALSVVLYNGEKMGSDISKIVKIAEVIADENGEADVALKLADSVPTGKYTLSVAGGGTLKSTGSIDGLKYVSKNDTSQIIADINGASISDIKSVFDKYNDIFALPSDEKVYAQFLSAKKDDYGSFTTVEDIKRCLKTAQLLYDINSLTGEADILDYIKTNAKGLSFDIEDADFKASEQKFAIALKKLKTKKALTGMHSFEEMSKKALAIGVVNSSNAQNMTSAIVKYADILGISKNDYQTNCTKYGAVEINKALRDMNFENTEDILNAYNNRINTLKNNNSSGGGSSGSGAAVSSDIGMVHVNTVESVPNFVDFTDLADASWAESSIKELASKGIVSGYEDKSFKPNKKVTREEFITLIVRAYNAYNAEAKNEFSDINVGDWCYQYVASAADKGYVSGFEDGSFGKGNNISRQDAATILYRVGQANGVYFNNGELNFADSEDISEYATDAVGALNNAGIISGFEDGSFRPLESLTRAQAAVMIGTILNF